jgi:hypothetical protein
MMKTNYPNAHGGSPRLLAKRFAYVLFGIFYTKLFVMLEMAFFLYTQKLCIHSFSKIILKASALLSYLALSTMIPAISHQKKSYT